MLEGFTCTTSYGIDFKCEYEYESEEQDSSDCPGSPENICAWPVSFTYDELALADAWVYGGCFTDAELTEDKAMIEAEVLEEAWKEVRRAQQFAEECRVERILESRED